MTCGASSGDDWRLPSSVTLTQEESTERAALYADISDHREGADRPVYQRRSGHRVQLGRLHLCLEASGMERAIEITQAAYDRLALAGRRVITRYLRKNRLSLREDPPLAGSFPHDIKGRNHYEIWTANVQRERFD